MLGEKCRSLTTVCCSVSWLIPTYCATPLIDFLVLVWNTAHVFSISLFFDDQHCQCCHYEHYLFSQIYESNSWLLAHLNLLFSAWTWSQTSFELQSGCYYSHRRPSQALYAQACCTMTFSLGNGQKIKLYAHAYINCHHALQPTVLFERLNTNFLEVMTTLFHIVQ